jgi:hypothetical protein
MPEKLEWIGKTIDVCLDRAFSQDDKLFAEQRIIVGESPVVSVVVIFCVP